MSSDEARETWRPVVGYEGAYEVSDCGRARSVDRVVTRTDGSLLPLVGRIRAQHIDRGGYLRVSLSRDSKTRGARVHILVAKAFLSRPPGEVEVCHRNGNPRDNRVANLRWGTHKSNVEDAMRQGTFARGSRRATAKLSEESIPDIRRLAHEGVSYNEIGRLFGVHHATIRSAVIGRSWSHVE